MRGGDYTIHVYVQQAKQIKLGSSNQTIDPLIEVTCLGKKQYTQVKNDINRSQIVDWSEHLFFEFNALVKNGVSNMCRE